MFDVYLLIGLMLTALLIITLLIRQNNPTTVVYIQPEPVPSSGAVRLLALIPLGCILAVLLVR